ncbi:MAG TPA: hypothetical protein VFA56_08790 [Gaiellaceae bacterium]|nr:hypothetical protein [Gaiellaceae bacterium]
MLRWWLKLQARRLGLCPPDAEFERVGPFWRALHDVAALRQRRHAAR